MSKHSIKLVEGLGFTVTLETKNCAECIQYDHSNETCLKFNAKPPAKVIVVGCDKFEPDIPF